MEAVAKMDRASAVMLLMYEFFTVFYIERLVEKSLDSKIFFYFMNSYSSWNTEERGNEWGSKCGETDTLSNMASSGIPPMAFLSTRYWSGRVAIPGVLIMQSQDTVDESSISSISLISGSHEHGPAALPQIESHPHCTGQR